MRREDLAVYFNKLYKKPLYRIFLWLLGIFSMPLIYIRYLRQKKKGAYLKILTDCQRRNQENNLLETLYEEAVAQAKAKAAFFGKTAEQDQIEAQSKKEAKSRFLQICEEEALAQARNQQIFPANFCRAYGELIQNNGFLIYSILFSLPMYLLLLIYKNPYVKYIFERLIMMVFVIFGVTFLVFTILYSSPLDPAQNILGQEATPEQIASFQRDYGLDKPYPVQLLNTFKNLFSFDLGKSFAGNEDVLTAIMRKFPVTLRLSFISLFLAALIAIPAGIISAVKPYSSFDYVFMLLALIGLSVPNFWLGLIMILNFSINQNLLPSTYVVGNWHSLIMPAIVLGTSLSASVARMTRSSMLEVKNMDYIMTARAKGLSERRVVLKHILGNAMIPIVTVIGLQFGGMLGGSAVTEKVFNINGIGSFIVDKQFVPDIPIVLAGVVYVAIVISIANLLVDIIYAFLDPRIKSKMKNY